MAHTSPAKSPGLPPQGEFNYDHNLPAGIETFSLQFLAVWFKTSLQHWINLIDSGAIKATNLSSPGASKAMRRIPRAELIRFLNERTQ